MAISRRVTQAGVEVVVQDTNATRHVTQMGIEVILASSPRFWAVVIT